MTLRAKLPTAIAKSGITLSKVQLLADLEQIVGDGMVHCFAGVTAQSTGGVLICNDLVTGRAVQSGGTAPVIDAAINGKPTVTHGTGPTGIVGQSIRANNSGDLDVGIGAWSVCMLIKVMGVGPGADYVLGYVPLAKTGATDSSPMLRFQPSGDKNMAPVMVMNDGSTVKAFCNTKEFYNTSRVLCISHTPGVGVSFYIDNWSSPELVVVTDAAKAPLTDGRFVIGTVGAGITSLNLAGSWAAMTLHNLALSANDRARRDVMKTLAGYGGTVSN